MQGHVAIWPGKLGLYIAIGLVGAGSTATGDQPIGQPILPGFLLVGRRKVQFFVCFFFLTGLWRRHDCTTRARLLLHQQARGIMHRNGLVSLSSARSVVQACHKSMHIALAQMLVHCCAKIVS